MTSSTKDMTPLFPYRSSGVPVLMDAGSTTRTLDVGDFPTYATFVPLGDDGVYPRDAWAFDQMMDLSPNSMIHFTNYHLVSTLVSQKKVGTPLLDMTHLDDPDLNRKDYQSLIIKPTSYVDNNVNFGSPYFKHDIAMRVSDLLNLNIVAPKMQPKKHELDHDPVLMKFYGNTAMLSLNYKLGYYGDETRNKFDIIFLPMYRKPWEKKYEDREIFGFISFFICCDPLWKMRDALDFFKRAYHEYKITSRLTDKNYMDFTNDPRILDFLEWSKLEEFYTSHFNNYIAINPKQHKSTIMSGINLNPDNSNTFETFLKYENALAHAVKYAKTVGDDAKWMEFYGSVYKRNMVTFQPAHDAYIFDYTKFIWNSNNDFHVTAANPREGRGLFYEYFPWVTKAYIHESNTIRGFERIQESLFIEATADVPEDAMDIDENDNTSSPVKNQMDSIYTNVFNTLQGINTNAENTFIPSENNVNVEMGERVRHAISECLNDINAYINQNQTIFEILLTPQHIDGLKSLSPQEVELVNDKLTAVAKLHERLTNIQERILKVAKNRIFSLTTVKPTTPTFLAMIQYLNGKVLKTELPQANQNALDIVDTKPIQKRNIWQYQLHKLDSTLDIVAHSSMYFVTTVRYFMYNARCIHDIYKLVVGMTDAFRTEFNLHFNYGLFGHLGSSKSHAVDEFKKLCLPNSITSVTNQSALANSVSKDMSDRILVMDEGAQILASNSKGGSTANYSPEASALKAELTQGFTSRQILDIGKNFKDRQTRNILSIKIGSVAITANLWITDLAFRSRWHCAMSEMESDIPKKKKKKNTPTTLLTGSSNSLAASENSNSSAATTPEEQRLQEQNQQRNKLAMPDMFLHVPSSRTKQTASFFTESMHMQHAFSFTLWKLIQIGVFQRPSMHVICLVAIICKYLKATLKISIPVRTVQRIIIFMQNLSILNAIHMLFNTPGLHEDLKKRVFDLDLFLYLRPYLCSSPQMVVMSFSMLSCEYIKASENIIIDGIVEALKMNTIPVERLDLLCHYRNIEFATRENPLLARVNDFMSAIPESIESDPLWSHFKTNARLPLEQLYFENNRNNKMANTFRRKHPNTAALLLRRQQTGRRPIAVDANAMDNPPPADTNGDNDIKIDLVYLSTGKTRTKIIEHLINLYGKRIIPDQIRSSFVELEEMKITVDTVMPVSEAELQALEPGSELETVQRSFNLIECDETDTYVSIYIFSELMNRPGNTNVIVQAIKSFFYRGLKPCTFMTGSELVDDTYDLEFGMHKITAADLAAPYVPDYLYITDPSAIQSTFDNKTGKLLDKIKKNMIRMTKMGQDAARDITAQASSIRSMYKSKKKKMNSVAITNPGSAAAQEKLKDSNALDKEAGNKIIQALETKITASLQTQDDTNAIVDSDKNEEFLALLRPEESKAGHEKIYIDMNEWVFVKHALVNGIPLRIDPETRTYMYKPYKSDTWTPIPTPSNISVLHQSYDNDTVDMVDTPEAVVAAPTKKRSRMNFSSASLAAKSAPEPAKKKSKTKDTSLASAITSSLPQGQISLFGTIFQTSNKEQSNKRLSEEDAVAIPSSPLMDEEDSCDLIFTES